MYNDLLKTLLMILFKQVYVFFNYVAAYYDSISGLLIFKFNDVAEFSNKLEELSEIISEDYIYNVLITYFTRLESLVLTTAL